MLTKDKNKEKTIFTSHLGTFRYTNMQFGLRSAPASFHSVLDIISFEVQWKTCFNYIDNVVIVSKNNGQNVKDMEEVLTLPHQARVILKLPKSHFLQKKGEYLGHILTHVCLATASQKFDAIKTAVIPTESRHMRLFLSACDDCRRSIRNVYKIARHLNEHLPEDMELKWLNPMTESLDALNALKFLVDKTSSVGR